MPSNPTARKLPVRHSSLALVLPSLAAALLLVASLQTRLAARPATTVSASAGFSFVQMCDTQLGWGGYRHDVKTFNLAVNQINRMKPDFVLICGDLVHKANEKSWADFNRIKAGFKIPCHCAAGNHDVGNKPSAKSLQLYREKAGKDYYTVEHKGFTFVIANTQLWKAQLEGESEKHDTWFRETLAKAKERKRPVVLVVHYPLFVDDPEEKETYWNIPPAKRGEILELCEKNGVLAILSGHRHRLVINKYKGIQLVTGESTSKNYDRRPMGFRWWDVNAKGKMSHRFVELEGWQNLGSGWKSQLRRPKIGSRRLGRR